MAPRGNNEAGTRRASSSDGTICLGSHGREVAGSDITTSLQSNWRSFGGYADAALDSRTEESTKMQCTSHLKLQLQQFISSPGAISDGLHFN